MERKYSVEEELELHWVFEVWKYCDQEVSREACKETLSDFEFPLKKINKL